MTALMVPTYSVFLMLLLHLTPLKITRIYRMVLEEQHCQLLFDALLILQLCNNNGETQEDSTSNSIASMIYEDFFKVGRYFLDKDELKTKLYMLIIQRNFEFKVKKSNKNLLVLFCVDPNYK